MACLHLIKCGYVVYVQIHKLHNNCYFSQISKIDQRLYYTQIQAIAYIYLYKNTVLLLDRYIKPGIGIYFKSTTY